MRYPYRSTIRVPHPCAQLTAEVVDPAAPLWYLPWAREVVVERLDVGFTALDFCPFCGARLPESLRALWWDTHDAADESPGWDPDGDAWWREDPQHAVPLVDAVPDAAVLTPRPATRAEAALARDLVRALGDPHVTCGIHEGVPVVADVHDASVEIADAAEPDALTVLETGDGDVQVVLGVHRGVATQITFLGPPSLWLRHIEVPGAWRVAS